ncbi:MAG: hypothetical protein NTV86_12095 [Planctomycetota bacterium]|nr:hypothetical protein [Planctomycetota bacterium]
MAARLEHPDGRRCRLWWRLPAEWEHALTTWADPFVVGLLFPMMQWQTDVRVEGPVSPSLLANLERFMAVWRMWFPERYRPVHIAAAEENEPPRPAGPEQTVVPFSCGVDSCFTLWRHVRGLAGRQNRTIGAAVVFHGFDIWLDQPNADAIYAGLIDNARTILADVNVPCIPMTSNFHELPTLWKHSFATHLVSGLMLLQGRFTSTLIPSNVGYEDLGRAWAGHPLSDAFLGGEAFDVRDDGPECLRAEKIALIADWPEAMRRLRVCFCNPHSAANCGVCEKCLRTMLSFKAAGFPVPPAFGGEPTLGQIRRARFPHRHNIVLYWRQIAAAARARGLGGAPWVRAALAAIGRNRRRWFLGALKHPLIPTRNAVRRLVRGTALSRGQQAKRTREDSEP